jgi:hypothetical protein
MDNPYLTKAEKIFADLTEQQFTALSAAYRAQPLGIDDLIDSQELDRLTRTFIKATGVKLTPTACWYLIRMARKLGGFGLRRQPPDSPSIAWFRSLVATRARLT